MRILQLQPRVPLYGGAEKVMVRLANYFDAHGHDADIAMPYYPDGMLCQLEGQSAVHKIELWQAPLLARRYDVVIAHNFPATVAAALGRRPVIWWCHEPPEMFTCWWRKPIEWAHRQMVRGVAMWARVGIDTVMVAGPHTQGQVRRLYKREPVEVPYGCDTGFFNAPSTRGEWPEWDTMMEDARQDGEVVVAQVGLVTRYKRQDVTVRAVAELQAQGTKVRLAIVGHGPDPEYDAELNALVRARGVKVERFGHQSRERVRRVFQTADLISHPCVEQGGWLVPFEAMAAGAVVVVDERAPCAEFMRAHRLPCVTSDFARAFVARFTEWVAWREEAFLAAQWVRANMGWDAFGAAVLAQCEEVA